MSGSSAAPASANGASRTWGSRNSATWPARGRSPPRALEGSNVELIVFGTCSHDDQVPNMASGIQARIGAQPAAAYGHQHRLHQLSLRAVDRDRADPHRRGAQRAGDRRGAHLAVHGLDRSRRRGAVRRRRRRRGAGSDRARGGRAGREARLLRRRARDPARAGHGRALRQPRRALRRHALAVRGAGDLQARRAGHEQRLRGRARAASSSRRTTWTSWCRTRRTCASSRPWPGARTCRWNGSSSTSSATATCPRPPCRRAVRSAGGRTRTARARCC